VFELDRVELLVDLGIVADQVTGPADTLRKLVAEQDDSEALADLAPDPFGGSSSGSACWSSSIVVLESKRLQIRMRTITQLGAWRAAL